jgi:hypothetical protein
MINGYFAVFFGENSEIELLVIAVVLNTATNLLTFD